MRFKSTQQSSGITSTPLCEFICTQIRLFGTWRLFIRTSVSTFSSSTYYYYVYTIQQKFWIKQFIAFFVVYDGSFRWLNSKTKSGRQKLPNYVQNPFPFPFEHFWLWTMIKALIIGCFQRFCWIVYILLIPLPSNTKYYPTLLLKCIVIEMMERWLW